MSKQSQRQWMARAGVAGLWAVLVLSAPPSGIAPLRAQNNNEIGALCRLEPAKGVLNLVGPGGARVASIRVTTGDFVKRGAVLLTTSGFSSAQADVKNAQAAIERDKKAIAAKVAAQAAAVRVQEAEAAQTSYALQSYVALGSTATAEKEKRIRQYNNQAAQASLAQARALLEVEKADAVTALANSAAKLRDARLKLLQTAIVAPMDGEILDIRFDLGETLDGLAVVMGDVRRMKAVCDVFEGDLRRIQAGSSARISSASLSKSVRGSVIQVGKLINGDTRLGKVVIALDNPAAVARHVGMEVQATITP